MVESGCDAGGDVDGRHCDLRRLIERAATLLPLQGPITVFIHHNPLHAFEGLPFDEAVKKAGSLYGCRPYSTEDYYRGEVAKGRISADDLAAVLLEDLGDDADQLIGFMGTRYHLRLAMLEQPLRIGPEAELRWLIAEADALERFRREAPAEIRRRMIERTRRWVLKDHADRRSAGVPGRENDLVSAILGQFDATHRDRWGDRTWEAVTLNLLWRICHAGAHGIGRSNEGPPPQVRHRDLLLQATGYDLDITVGEVLIPFCAAFLDQGFATWTLPGREGGFLKAFMGLYRDAKPVARWLRGLPAEVRRLEESGGGALESIDGSLIQLGVAAGEREEFIVRSLLALRGWAGMLWQMETNVEWATRPAPAGTLEQYLAVRLLLERQALEHAAREWMPGVAAPDYRAALRRSIPHPPRASVDQRAYLVFQLAQVRGWSPADLLRLSKADWSRLIGEIESFDGLERRRIYHNALERSYRNRTLDALGSHSPQVPRLAGDAAGRRPEFQVVACLDDREESFRRHVEEIAPACETFGVAGFFGAAMYYRGATEAHFRPLCPINVKPRHYVEEVAGHAHEHAVRLQSAARRRLGRASHRFHVGSRSFLGGVLAGMVGSLATVPLVMRVLSPRRTARIRHIFARMVSPPSTRLSLLRSGPHPGSDAGQLGYSHDEMAGVVGATLRAMGLTGPFALLVIIVGHGSSSLNNPQEAAYDCGACGGSRGGPNARAFAQMANDPCVRRMLAQAGIVIPDDVAFVGAYHNTCDDAMTYFDLDRLPPSHGETFGRARIVLDEARGRNAQERCRRFRSAPLTIAAGEALRHVEARSEDLSQTRPEYGHSSNAVCFVGRRSRTRGLFLDRRAFLASYDPSRDDPAASILAGVLQAVVPVCAGISLEYLFSTVDNGGYGCGTKLPHNITSLLGVMDGAMSDLRPGLSQQMIEIHEPVRILFVVEASPAAVSTAIAGAPALERLVRNRWVQFATLDPESSAVHCFRDGAFEPYEGTGVGLPTAPSSRAWYRGWREHLSFASIVGEAGGVAR